MTVEQRIYEQGFENPIVTKIIKPGEISSIKVVGVESEHLDEEGIHQENPITFIVSCARDNSEGLLSFKHPTTQETTYRYFSGESTPHYMIRRPSGKLGLIEWVHKK